MVVRRALLRLKIKSLQFCNHSNLAPVARPRPSQATPCRQPAPKHRPQLPSWATRCRLREILRSMGLHFVKRMIQDSPCNYRYPNAERKVRKEAALFTINQPPPPQPSATPQQPLPTTSALILFHPSAKPRTPCLEEWSQMWGAARWAFRKNINILEKHPTTVELTVFSFTEENGINFGAKVHGVRKPTSQA